MLALMVRTLVGIPLILGEFRSVPLQPPKAPEPRYTVFTRVVTKANGETTNTMVGAAAANVAIALLFCLTLLIAPEFRDYVLSGGFGTALIIRIRRWMFGS